MIFTRKFIILFIAVMSLASCTEKKNHPNSEKQEGHTEKALNNLDESDGLEINPHIKVISTNHSDIKVDSIQKNEILTQFFNNFNDYILPNNSYLSPIVLGDSLIKNPSSINFYGKTIKSGDSIDKKTPHKVLDLFFDSFKKDSLKSTLFFEPNQKKQELKTNPQKQELFIEEYYDLEINKFQFFTFIISFYIEDNPYYAILLSNKDINDGLILFEYYDNEGIYLRTSDIQKNLIDNRQFLIDYFTYNEYGEIDGEAEPGHEKITQRAHNQILIE